MGNKVKRYCLQRYDGRDDKAGIEYWQRIKDSENLEVIKLFCPAGYRIIDNVTKEVAWEIK
ncbi:hypothetical protein [Paenibacillus sp. HGF7]|uniref:hypothetical protein n=1 Tax=Paenibacillus sp. HGF7 TaxID=944559 RepID=UPI0014791681|nr:hypothetical protein [Paenibacillus sp. HGF7]